MFGRQFWCENSNSERNGINIDFLEFFKYLNFYAKIVLKIALKCNMCLALDINFGAKIQIHNWNKYFSNVFELSYLKSVHFWHGKLKDFFMIFERFFMLNLASFEACKKVLSTIGMRTDVINLCELFT